MHTCDGSNRIAELTEPSLRRALDGGRSQGDRGIARGADVQAAGVWPLALIVPAILCVLSIGNLAIAQTATQPSTTETPAQPAPLDVSAEVVESRKKQLEAVQDLDDESRQQAMEFYRQAAEDVKRATDFAALAGKYKNDAEAIQDRVAELKNKQEALQNEKPTLPELNGLAEYQQALTKQELQLTEMKAALVKAEADYRNRINRRKEIRTLLFTAPERLAEINKQIDMSPPADEKPELTLAKRTAMQARRLALQQEIQVLQNEVGKLDAEDTVDLGRIDLDLRAKEIAAAEKQFQLLDNQVKQLRNKEATDAVQKAIDETIAAQPLLKKHAERNRELAEQSQEITTLMVQADAKLKQTKARLEEVERQYRQTREKVDTIGLTNAIGLLLRKQQASLPNVYRRRQNVAARKSVIADVQYELFELEDERSDTTRDQAVRDIIAGEAPTLTGARLKQLTDATKNLLARRIEYLDPLIRNMNTYFDTLVELDSTEQQLISDTEEYAGFIDEHVLWIRSSKPLTRSEFRLEEQDRVFLDPDEWMKVVQILWVDMYDNLITFAAAALLFGSIYVVQFRFRQELGEIGRLARRSNCYEFAITGRAAFLTGIIAILWPGIVWYFGWRLTVSAGEAELAKAVATGMHVTAISFAGLSILRQSCRRGGLAESHFDWSATAVSALRSNLNWLMISLLPLILVISTLNTSRSESGYDALERIAFITAAITFAYFLFRVLRPSGPVLKEFLAYHRGGWIDWMRYVWFLTAIILPVVFAVGAAIGFYYTAQQLSLRLLYTLWGAVVLLLVRAFLLRLILVNRRKLSIEQARERRAAALALAQKNQEGGEQGDNTLNPVTFANIETEAANLARISSQTQRLISTGMAVVALVSVWLIWSDVLPALNFLDRWPLWTTNVQVTEEVIDANNKPYSRTIDKVEPITLAHLALAILIAIFTGIAANNLPGLIEMWLLRQLPLDAAIRYAIKMLSSYAIVLLGVITSLGSVGLGWAQVQWLATALTFGLAFGLQEIFANFVAGLIILFERPIRVGDIVTIDDVSGVVARVRIRATTITNWDRKEFIVPNKEFITGRLLNWTLTDQINRVVINVGVAYGSNTKQATELLLKVAQEHPITLDDPPSLATFEGFGDSTLNLVLRTFLPNMDNRLAVIHELYSSIDREFREAGIEIAFPQRDLHVRSLPEGLRGPKGGESSVES